MPACLGKDFSLEELPPPHIVCPGVQAYIQKMDEIKVDSCTRELQEEEARDTPLLTLPLLFAPATCPTRDLMLS